MSVKARNVLGGELADCSARPLTGFFRDGCCNTSDQDRGSHTVCVLTTAEFLAFSSARGNDLSTPVPEFEFPGLKPGDRWCLCAARWQEALRPARPRALCSRRRTSGRWTTAGWRISSAMRWICCEGGTCEPPVQVTTPAAGPPALKAKDLAAAKALLQDPEITVVEVAKRLGVAASTLYRHLPRARTAALEA